MKKIYVFVFVVVFFCFVDNTSFAWGGSLELGTHYRLGEEVVAFLSSHNLGFKAFFMSSKEYIKLYLKGIYEADNKEFVAGTHYYIGGSETSEVGKYHLNRKKKYKRSARTNLEEHYTLAYHLYKNNMFEAASYEFGLATHYIMDMCCPPHAIGIWGFNHSSFESYTDANLEVLNKKSIEFIDFKLNLVDFMNHISKISSLDKYSMAIINNEQKDEVINETLFNTKVATLYLIKLFLDDLNSERIKPLINGNEYHINNKLVNIYIDNFGFRFKDKMGLYLKAKKFKRIKFESKVDKTSYFRLSYFDGKYLISPYYKTYSFVLDHDLKVRRMNPNNKLIWFEIK